MNIIKDTIQFVESLRQYRNNLLTKISKFNPSQLLLNFEQCKAIRSYIHCMMVTTFFILVSHVRFLDNSKMYLMIESIEHKPTHVFPFYLALFCQLHFLHSSLCDWLTYAIFSFIQIRWEFSVYGRKYGETR